MKLQLANLFSLKAEGQPLNALPMEGSGGGHLFKAILSNLSKGNGAHNPTNAQAGGQQMLQQQLLACQLGPVTPGTGGEAQTAVDLGHLASSFPVTESGTAPNPHPFPIVTEPATSNGTESSQGDTTNQADPWPAVPPCHHDAFQANPFALVLPQAQDAQPEQSQVTLESKKPANIFQAEAPAEPKETADVTESESEELEVEVESRQQQAPNLPLPEQTSAPKLPVKNKPELISHEEMTPASSQSQTAQPRVRTSHNSSAAPHQTVESGPLNIRATGKQGQAPVQSATSVADRFISNPTQTETSALTKAAISQPSILPKTQAAPDLSETHASPAQNAQATIQYAGVGGSETPRPEREVRVPSSSIQWEAQSAPATGVIQAPVDAGPALPAQENKDRNTQTTEALKMVLKPSPAAVTPGSENPTSQKVTPMKLGAAPVPTLVKPSRAIPAPATRESADSKIIAFSEKRNPGAAQPIQMTSPFVQPTEGVTQAEAQSPSTQPSQIASGRVTRLKQFVPSPPPTQLAPIANEAPSVALAQNLPPVFGSPFGVPTALAGGDIATNSAVATPPLNFESLSKEVFPMVKVTRVQNTAKPTATSNGLTSVEAGGNQAISRDRAFSSNLQFVMSPAPEQTGAEVTTDSPKWTYQTPEKASGHLSLVRSGPKFQVAHQDFARNLADIGQVQAQPAPIITAQSLPTSVPAVNSDLITMGVQDLAEPPVGEDGLKIQETQPSLPETTLDVQTSETVGAEKIHVSRVTKLLEKQLTRVNLPEAQKIELELEPDRLGKLVVELSVDKKTHKVEGHLIVANESAREALEQHLPGLKAKLTEQGIDFDSKLTLTSENHRGSDTSGRGQNGQSKTGHTPHREAETSDGESDRTPPKGREIYA